MSHTPRHLPTETVIKKQSLFDSFDADSVVDWLVQNGKNVVYALLALLALFILVYKLSSSNAAKSEKDFFSASTEFSRFINENGSNDEAAVKGALQKLNAIMNSHPELHAAYDGAIGQTLLDRGLTTEAKPFIVSTLKRTQDDNLKLYNQFANTTLLIGETQYTKALEQAQALQQSMLADVEKIDDRSFNEILFAFNLIRIAMLHQQLGNDKEELQSWQQWKNYAGLNGATHTSNSISSTAFRIIIQQMATGNLSLPDYIAYREKVLK